MRKPRTVLRGGTVFDGAGGLPRKADLSMVDGAIETIGSVESRPDDVVVDASGRYLLPGFIDSHSHADAAIFSADVQRGLLRQGVTTIITGQDGVSYAPGDGHYASDYFSALLGRHPGYRGGGVGELLASYDGTIPVNVGYLVPAGTIRHEVRGYAAGVSSPEEIVRMRDLVAQALDEGALGLSTGLDYVPNIYADTAELIALCRPVAAVGGIYVTHMRGGYESNAAIGVEETAAIALATGVAVHISHYHGPTALLLSLADDVASRGVSMTFDTYPYRRGCTLLAMPVLPASLLSAANAEVAATLRDPAVRADLLDVWFPSLEQNPEMGPEWASNLTLSHIAAADYDWAHGLTVREAAQRAGVSPEVFTLDVLAASSLEVSAVMTVRSQRRYHDLESLFTHSGHVAGSDGIYIGSHPHPRAWGTFAKYLSLVTRERGSYSWSDAAVHLSGRAAERFCLMDRGRLAPGYAADIAVIDPALVDDLADYDSPKRDSVGIDDVFVAGQHVLADGQLTGVHSGRGLRRSAPVR
jgi:N-acyl-D-amino-acid deacylase